MSAASSRYRIGEAIPAKTLGELSSALATLAGDDPDCPVILTLEDEHLLVSLVRDHGCLSIEIEPDNTETALRWELHESRAAIENGEPDLDARVSYLEQEIRKEQAGK